MNKLSDLRAITIGVGIGVLFGIWFPLPSKEVQPDIALGREVLAPDEVYRIVRVYATGGGSRFWFEIQYSRNGKKYGDWLSPDCYGAVAPADWLDGFSPCVYSTYEEAVKGAMSYLKLGRK